MYADLGYADAGEMQRKSQLAGEIARAIKARHLSQSEAAEQLGIDQSLASLMATGRISLAEAMATASNPHDLTFQIPEPRVALLTPYDKGAIAAIEKAIRDSDLGVSPGNDGIMIRVNLPTLTEERRKEYIKVAHHKAEDARISIRNIRRSAKEAIEKLVKLGGIGEDDVARAEKELDKSTADRIDKVDESLKHKEAELLEV